MSDLKELFEYFESQQDRLFPEHSGEFALVADNAIHGLYETREAATGDGIKEFGIGNFLVQEILPPDQRIVEYHSRVAFTARA